MNRFYLKQVEMKHAGTSRAALAVIFSFCVATCGLSQTGGAGPKANGVISLDKISSTIRDQYGRKLTVANHNQKYYLQGDFNGDGFADIAVLVNVEEGREELKAHNVKYINIDPYSNRNGLESDPSTGMWNNCLGIALMHGSAAGWESPVTKYIFYQCFSDFRIIRKGQPIRRGAGSRGPTPIPKGDSIQLDLESGGASLIYWDGKTYRGFGQRGGD